MMKQGIKMKDAAYPACAIVAGCVYFATTDDKLINNSVKKALINCLCGMKRKAHGAQEPRHI